MKHTLFPKLVVQKPPQLYGKQRYLCRFHKHKDMCVRERERERFISLVFGSVSWGSYSCMPTNGSHCRSEARPLLCFWTNQSFFFPFISCLSCDPFLGLLFTIVLSILFQNLVAFTWNSCRWWFSSDQYESPF